MIHKTMDRDFERITKAHPLHLSIPKTQLGSITENAASPAKKKKQSLLLLQLPQGCTSPKDLKSFVGRDEAALIVGDHSYSVHRVETSNTLLLVPPKVERPHKRGKHEDSDKSTSAALEQQSVVHRLGGGDVSASFLELRRKYLKVADVVSALPVWDPFDDSPCSPESIPDLSIQLQASEAELQDFLDRVLHRAIRWEDGKYVMMTEQVQQICATAIVATLTEEDEYADDKGKSVDVDDFTRKSVQRIIPSEAFPNMALTVKHVLRQSFAVSPPATNEVALDWTKVASWVARQLLLSRREPWEDEDFFITWQREMPGIDMKVHRDMLQGVAVLVGTAWSAVSVDGIFTPKEMFEKLFRIKDKWFREELQPYLKLLCKADSSIVSPEQLLIRFTSPLQEQRDGLDVTMYQSKG